MKKKISVLLSLLLLVMALPLNVSANEIPEDVLMQEEMNLLLDKRAELICLEKYDEVYEIDAQLASLGVEELTPQEVQEKFIDTNPMARVTVPVASNVNWYSTSFDYPYNGTTYTVQTLIAQANEKSSNLKESGSRAIASTYKWQAGFMNALTAFGSGLLGEIPGSSIYLTVYDTVSGAVSGISKTTEISSAEIVYSWSHVTTASFKYVKVKGQTDDYQSLTYISTKGVTAIGYQYPTFTYSGGTVKPNVIQGSRTINSTPIGYDSNLNAVKAYTDVYAPTRAYNDTVKITGLESKTVSNIYPVCPQFPLHIY